MKDQLNIRLSKNFSLIEFVKSKTASENYISNQFEFDFNIVQNIRDLTTHVLQPIRDVAGVMHITSGYRCEELNKLVGGAQNSQHLQGRAVDFICKNRDLVIEVINYLPYDQFIIYDSFFHVSFDLKRNRKEILIR